MRLPLPSRLRPWHAWFLAAALLFAQATGLVHRQAAMAWTPAAHDAVVVAADTVADPHWGHDHSPGSADCRLIDQLAQADALCGGATLGLPLLKLGDTPLTLAVAGRQAAAPALYLARAPPRA